MEETKMFNFRLIDLPDGNQIIDTTLTTLYSSLTPLQMIDYIEVDNQIAIMERIERQKQKADKNLLKKLLWRLLYICGII